VRGQKMALLVLLKGRLVGGAKPNVPFVRWQFKIFCAVEKKLKHSNVLQLGEVADFEALTFNLALMFI
jgi:hypothetical protein